MKKMLNNVVLVGRIVSDIEKNKTDEKAIITIAIPRNYKNSNEEYDTDFIDCVLWKDIAKNVTEYCAKGDIVGIKGRVQKLKDEQLTIVAEKVTFLSTKKRDDSNE